MADIAAANVTYSVDMVNSTFLGRRGFLHKGTISFGNGTLTYPAGGIPLTKAAMGCPNFLDEVFAFKATTGLVGFMYMYVRSTEKIMIIAQSVTTGATATATNEDGALATNSAGTELAAPRLPKTAISTSYDLGPQKQIGNIAIAALVLDCQWIGY